MSAFVICFLHFSPSHPYPRTPRLCLRSPLSKSGARRRGAAGLVRRNVQLRDRRTPVWRSMPQCHLILQCHWSSRYRASSFSNSVAEIDEEGIGGCTIDSSRATMTAPIPPRPRRPRHRHQSPLRPSPAVAHQSIHGEEEPSQILLPFFHSTHIAI
jgi:hypothetical protein